MSAAVLAVLLALQAPLAGEDETQQSAPAEVDRILSEPSYRFCRDEFFPLNEEEHAWCSLADDTSSRCRAFRHACKAEPVAGRQESTGARKKADPSRRADKSSSQPEDSTIELPLPIGLMRVVFIALAVVFAVAVIGMIVRNLLRDRSDKDEPVEEPQEPASDRVEAPAPGPVETDVERLLSRARAAASRGDFASAIRDAYAALLRRLHGDGLIDMHPSRTNGDYVRALRERPELKEPVREIVADVESVQFGSVAPSQEVFRRILDRVLPLVSRATMVLLLVVLATGQGGCDRKNASKEHRPLGNEAVIELLRAHGRQVEQDTRPITQIPAATTLVVEGADIDETQWTELLTWVERDGGMLVLLGVPERHAAELGVRIKPADPSATKNVTSGESDIGGKFLLAIPPGPSFEPTDERSEELLVRGEARYAAYRRLKTGIGDDEHLEGSVVMFADAQLLTNISMAVRDNGAYVADLFLRMPKDVVFWNGWAAGGAATPLESMRRAHMTPVVLQLLALIALFFLYKGVHFGTPREPARESSRAFVDHVRALGMAYFRARASRHVVGMYSAWALDRLREHARIHGRRGLLPLAEAIAQRTGHKESEVAKVLVEAQGMREDSGPPSSWRPGPQGTLRSAPEPDASDLQIMRRLESFLVAFGDARTRTGKR